jgi:23S rRNA (cytosine1962-C5)-methyltransferase
MSKFPSVILHNNKTQAIKRFHPWVFSGAVKRKEGNPDQGDVVEVYADNGEFLGVGHFGTGSVSVRIFSFERIETLQELWKQRFQSAWSLRKTSGLAESKDTTCYRLINAEGDGMPGLIVDWYNGTAVLQAHSKGMHREKEYFVEALRDIYGNDLKAVYDKSAATLNHKYNETVEPAGATGDAYLYGGLSENVVLENGRRFKVDWQLGQKTGFFIDQRDNRLLLSKFSRGKKVLNTFCYSGGFSVYAATAGATLVHSVDSSVKAVDWTNENVQLNAISGVEHQAFAEDVFDFMKNAGSDYDLIILDPPAFAKGQSARHSAIKAYTRLNHSALQKIKRGGIIFTFSCSQVVSTEMFIGAVTSAAIESGRKVRVLHHLTQPADHPVSIFNPEGLYLKGLVLYVE